MNSFGLITGTSEFLQYKPKVKLTLSGVCMQILSFLSGSFCLVNIKLLSVSLFDCNAFRVKQCVIDMMSNCSPQPDLLCQKFFALIKSMMPFMRFLGLKWLDCQRGCGHFRVTFVNTLHYTWIIDGLGYAGYCLFGSCYTRPVVFTVMHH